MLKFYIEALTRYPLATVAVTICMIIYIGIYLVEMDWFRFWKEVIGMWAVLGALALWYFTSLPQGVTQ